ncbi:hypothetical protein T492DRAFT_109539 [Pavlovales sp. CCMP2436]|nr:hypothetical protein T492DRAFT_109539 [Pavlovales sp. CCMP2436]
MLGLDVGGPDARLGGGLAGGFVDDFAAGDELGRDDQFGHEDDYDHHMHELGSGTPSPPLRHPAPAAADRVANGDEQQQDVFVSPRPAGPAAAARVPKLPGIKVFSTSMRVYIRVFRLIVILYLCIYIIFILCLNICDFILVIFLSRLNLFVIR